MKQFFKITINFARINLYLKKLKFESRHEL